MTDAIGRNARADRRRELDKSLARVSGGVARMSGVQDESGSAVLPAVAGVVIRPANPQERAPLRAMSGHVILPRLGLQLPGRFPFEAWLDIGRQLSAVVATSAWCLGDWLVYGQQAYESRYREATERTGLDYQTLRNYAWVARRFGMPRRRDTLSFGHHAEVAALPEPEQDFWLRKAEQLGWSTSQLRREVRASLAERKDRTEDDRPPSPADPDEPSEISRGRPHLDSRLIQIPLTREQSELYERAADGQGLPLPAWAAQVLDRAARGNL